MLRQVYHSCILLFRFDVAFRARERFLLLNPRVVAYASGFGIPLAFGGISVAAAVSRYGCVPR